MFQQRSRGVTAPTNQGSPANEGTPNTVVNAFEVKFVAVEFFDASGRRNTDVLLELNGEYYSPPNSQAWAAALKGVTSWLSKGIKRKLPSGPVKVTDTVDIVPEGG